MTPGQFATTKHVVTMTLGPGAVDPNDNPLVARLPAMSMCLVLAAKSHDRMGFAEACVLVAGRVGWVLQSAFSSDDWR